jgi:hypothetical protein
VSGGDDDLVRLVRLATVTPPRTDEEVGYYLVARENDFENCFRYTVSQLEPYTTSAEDKYVHEIFGQWFGEGDLSDRVHTSYVAWRTAHVR